MKQNNKTVAACTKFFLAGFTLRMIWWWRCVGAPATYFAHYFPPARIRIWLVGLVSKKSGLCVSWASEWVSAARLLFLFIIMWQPTTSERYDHIVAATAVAVASLGGSNLMWLLWERLWLRCWLSSSWIVHVMTLTMRWEDFIIQRVTRALTWTAYTSVNNKYKFYSCSDLSSCPFVYMKYALPWVGITLQ